MKIKIILLSLQIIILLFTKTSNSQEDFNYIEVSHNLYVITEISGGNVAFLVTKKGIVVVDAGSTPENGAKIVSIIKSVSNKPIKYLILTHFHGDHINGIVGFPRDVKIIAHQDLSKNNDLFNKKNLDNYINNVLPGYLVNLKLQMGLIENKESEEFISLKKDYETNLEYFEDIKNIKLREPDIAFENFYRFRIANERIMLEHPGPGHTNDNILVKFSNHNVIHMGDLIFNKMFPYTIEEHGVDIYTWVKILDDLYKENIYTVIPGHGEIGEKIILKEQSDYFKTLAQKIERLKKQNLSLDQIIAICDIMDHDLKGNEDQFKENIIVIYNQLTTSKVDWWNF
ncbi:MAG: MBL fold metallo-hydrolase [Bacteroidales bacterium]|nr:MBL fold metallo-hydrolase [Bacteroidales bacterium]